MRPADAVRGLRAPRPTAAALVVLALAVLAGCQATTPREADQPEPAPPDPAERTVSLATTPLGDHLVDRRGRTLYVRTDDEPGRTPRCDAACAEQWPPLLDDAPTDGAGAEADLLGVVQRADGATQVTYAGLPLHRHVDDAEPGEARGHGDGPWRAVGADGEPVDVDDEPADGGAGAAGGDGDADGG